MAEIGNGKAGRGLSSRTTLLRPASVLAVIVMLFGLSLAAIAVNLATREPLFPLTFTSGMELKSPSGQVTLESSDLTPEPGDIQVFEKLNFFFTRQDKIASLLRGGSLEVKDGAQTLSVYSRSRTASDLPGLFWIQVIVALGGLFISGWLWALHPRNLAVSFFWLSGLSMASSALTSAIYTTRALAIPESLFRTLEAINAWGASCFGMFMIALFLVYPRRLRGWQTLMAAEFVAFTFWTSSSLMQWSPEWAGVGTVIVVLLVLLCITIAVQFVATRRDPIARAALLWLGLSVVLGAGAFVMLNTVPTLLGLTPLNQGYAFLSFLIIYLGLAAGLSRFRLFEAGQWAFRFLFYTTGTLLFVLLDAALIYFGGMDQFPALGASLLAVGFFYLPTRDFLWRLLARRKSLQSHEVLAESLHVAFAPSEAERKIRWRSLVKKLFDPLDLEEIPDAVSDVHVEADGLKLILPSVAGLAALKISYPFAGRALFSPASLETASQIVAFIRQAESSREAYDRGVTEERRRIAQDLHDDVGARLLNGLYSSETDLRFTIEGAIADIRSIVNGISGEQVLLSDFLADLRHEATHRLGTAGITLEWSQIGEIYERRVDYRLHRALTSAVREVISNTVRHSGAKKLRASVEIGGEFIRLCFHDDGRGLPEDVRSGNSRGYGLKSLARRALDLQGELRLSHDKGGVELTLMVPFPTRS